MAVFIDFHSKDENDISNIMDNLTACSGICLFIDISSSTQIKYQKGLKEWVILLKNTFSILALQSKIKANTIKFIGDEIMIFIPVEKLLEEDGSSIKNYYTLLEEIVATVDILRLIHIDEMFLKCQASVHYCENVYNISFWESCDDYYGQDIDLSARLLSKAKENTIVLSERFYHKVLNDLATMGEPKNYGCLKRLSGRYVENFKGVPQPTEFRIINTTDS